jgi:hypothetical protein
VDIGELCRGAALRHLLARDICNALLEYAVRKDTTIYGRLRSKTGLMMGPRSSSSETEKDVTLSP